MTLAVPVDLIEVGCNVWALSSDTTDADMTQVKGGTVVTIETDVDQDTGEIQRRFVTAVNARGRLRFDVVTADEVAQAEPPSSSAMWNLVRLAAKEVAGAKKRGSDTARRIALQAELTKALG